MRALLLCLSLVSAATAAAETAGLWAVAPRSAWTLRELEQARAQLVSYDPDTGIAYVVATTAEQERLRAAGFVLSTVQPDVDAGLRRIAASRELGEYHTFDETAAELADLAARFPTLCALESIGLSLEGRDLWALKISDAPNENDASEPDVLVMGCHHAREFMSVEVPLHLANTLLEGYATDARLQRLVDERELWIVPMVNPDGHVYQEEFAASPDWTPPGWRKNRRDNGDGTYGVDLNRNYSFRWGHDDEGSTPEPFSDTYRGAEPFSEPETQAIRALAQRQRFVIALTYHSFGRLWLYPWGYTRNELPPDHAVFAALADSMVRSNGYRAGNAYFGTIYLTNGECTDYLYGELDPRKPVRTYAFTPELNGQSEGGFWPPESAIAPTCADILPSNLFALETADAVRRPLPPPQPTLTGTQDGLDPRRIELTWTQPVDADNPVHHWEVFEIAFSSAPAQAAATLLRSERAVLARRLPRPRSERLVLEVDARLAPLWDYAYVEARGADGAWVALRGEATRDGSPTGRNAGRGLTGGVVARRLGFDLGPVRGDRLDVAVRLDAAATAPEPPRVHAALDLAATYGEERRVIAPDVREPHYTLVAERAGLFAYGVTAVDADGQRIDSEIEFFLIPEVAVAFADVHLALDGDRARLAWSGDVRDATLEVWTRALGDDEPVPDAVRAWERGGLERVASAMVASARSGVLEWTATAARSVVIVRALDADGARLIGAWELEASFRTRIVGMPNPFRPGGGIELEIASPGALVVDVHSADGRRIRRLWSARRDAGRARLVWDGRDDAGRAVASGVYLVRLEHEARVAARRVVFLR